MADMLQEKCTQLMAEVVVFEDWTRKLEEEKDFFETSESPEYVTVILHELHRHRELLAEKRNELASLSCGCLKPRVA